MNDTVEYTLRFHDNSDGEDHEDYNQPLSSVLYVLASAHDGAVTGLVIEQQDGDL